MRHLKIVLFVLLLFVLVHLFQNRIGGQNFLNTLRQAGQANDLGYWLIVLFLLPLNWSLESLKWIRQLAVYQKISFKESLRSVLLGLAFQGILPFVFGDAIGRLISLENKSKRANLLAIFIGHYAQSLTLLFFGLAGFIILSLTLPDFSVFLWPSFFFVFLFFAGLGLYLFYNKKLKLFSERSFLASLNAYSLMDKYWILGLSFIRHVVFTIQYWALLKVFEIELPDFILLALIGLVFLFKTLGAFAGLLGDLLGRQLAVVYFFGLFSVSMPAVFSATLFLWLINIFVPMLVGSFLPFR